MPAINHGVGSTPPHPTAAAVAVLLLAPSSAAQANADDLALPPPMLATPHCAVAAKRSVDGESSAIVRAGCFATELEAQNFGAGVSSTSDASSSEAAASILLGQDHTGTYRSGSSLSGDVKACYDLTCADSLDALNNRASSIRYGNG